MSKSDSNRKDPTVVALPWLDPSWMEGLDRLGGRFAEQAAAANRETLDRLEVMMEDQLVFVRERLHADVSCCKALSEVRDPLEAAGIIANFWQDLFAAYRTCAERNIDTLSEIAAKAWANQEALAETAGQEADKTAATSSDGAPTRSSRSSAA